MARAWAEEGEEFVLERSKDGLNPISLGEEGDPAGAPMLLALDCMPGDQTLAIGDLRNGAPPTVYARAWVAVPRGPHPQRPNDTQCNGRCCVR